MIKREGEEHPDRQPPPDEQGVIPPVPGHAGEQDGDGLKPGRARNPKLL
jgi:hypothetical protein